jgi:hypothetical protein
MAEPEKKELTPNTDFVLSNGSIEIAFISEKVRGAYAIKSMATKEILATINALNGNVHSPSSFFHWSPEKNRGRGMDFALKAAIYLGLIREKRYLDSYPINLSELAYVKLCYGREYDPKIAISVTDFSRH